MEVKPDRQKARDIEEIFAIPSEENLTLEEAALKSDRLFVRSQDHLAFDNEAAKGVRLSAYQALKIFGVEKLREILAYGSAIIPMKDSEPAESLKQRREALGLTPALIAKKASVTEDDVCNAENPAIRTPMHILCKIAQTMCMDDMAIALHQSRKSESEFAYRLRDWGNLIGSTKQLTLGLNEAAWVIKKQLELATSTGKSSRDRFEPSTNYGARDYPVWKHGYYLAAKAREILGLGHEPIKSMRDLLEKELGIPLVQIELPDSIAGGTVSFDHGRGIFVNIQGNNDEAGVRRFTLAHELGHLLWDPDSELRRIVVDEYDSLSELTQTIEENDDYDFVEARANAFAIEFLAPGAQVKEVFQSENSPSAGLKKVMDFFGLSYTAAKYHIFNSLERGSVKIERLKIAGGSISDSWRARENFTIDFFKPESVPFSRRGRFAYEVVVAAEQKRISTDTAALWLGCPRNEYLAEKELVKSFFE